MGDRANICIIDRIQDASVYLYTHWCGTELPWTLQRALAKEWRWSDGPYLARIIFDEMTDGKHGGETGFGISTVPCDGHNRILYVNCQQQTVRRGDRVWTFSGYLNLSEEELELVWYDD